MALCSQAFSAAGKRSCEFSLQANANSKRVCLSKIDINAPSAGKRLPPICVDKMSNKVCYSSSSDSFSDSEDSQSCYIADQIRAKRRASSRVSFSLDNKLSKAVSQYSDDDDQDLDALRQNSGSNTEENLDCKLLSSPSSSSIYIQNLNSNIQLAQRALSCGSVFQVSDSCTSSGSAKNSMPLSDKQARAKCFDYLVGAIDEAWARYCDVASHVESETYGYNTPASVATDDEDDCGHLTDFTEYDTEPESKRTVRPVISRKPSIFGYAAHQVSEQTTDSDPSSCQLQALKGRLTKAKYFLQDLVDSDDFNDAFAYWKRWDMIKYATIELVEDDDDDEVIEATIDELEAGRLFSN